MRNDHASEDIQRKSKEMSTGAKTFKRTHKKLAKDLTHWHEIQTWSPVEDYNGDKVADVFLL